MSDPAPPASSFGCRLATLRQRVDAAAKRCGRSPAEVDILAVTKTASDHDLWEANACGQRRFAHNRVQALESQQRQLPDAEWHLIGPLQRNKARRALRLVSCIQSLADLPLAALLDRICAEQERPALDVLVQVNLRPSDKRHGVALDGLTELLEGLADYRLLQIRGLMTLAPHPADESEIRRAFVALRQAAEKAAEHRLLPAQPVLSMGMSQDLEIAVEEGATLLRVGRALFPSR